MLEVPALPLRFAAPRVLGEGAYGVVCAARDLDRNAPVAVKLLKDARGDALRRFKNEFRALAGITHRNLVGQHELVADGERWLLVMELVDGTDFISHATGMVADEIGALPTEVVDVADDGTPVREDDGERLRVRDADGVRRLIATAAELVAGLRALHATGRLHCDIKPSNVLVERGTGRVVILDLGMASGLSSAVYGPGRVAGTPSFMSPEQAGGGTLDEASDWYAVGAMLYQCLAGRLPFAGSASHVLFAKQIAEPPPLRIREADPISSGQSPAPASAPVPDDRYTGERVSSEPGAPVVAPAPPALVALVERMVARRAGDRPSGATIARALAALGGVADDDAPLRPTPGRARELAMLEAALAAGPRVAFVHGAAGLGRTLLCDRLAAAAAHGGALVLRGRTYPFAHVPFCALDELVDQLADALPPGPDGGRDSDDDVALLARLFPALRERAPGEITADEADPAVLRLRAARAFPRLFARAAAGRRLVIVLDDVHAGDDDSAPFLTALIGSGAAALIVVSYRDDEAGALPEALRRATPAGRSVEIPLGGLDADDAMALARAASPDMPAPLLEQAVIEAAGVPRFAVELARHAQGGGRLRLHDALAERLAALAAPARRLVATVAVAGRPIALEQALATSDLGDDALLALRAGLGDGWLREGRGRGGRALDVFHPRVRESVLAALSADETAARHGALADAIAAGRDPDPETLAYHLLGAGRPRDAAPHLVVAAERAAAALAFDHAAALHQQAIDLGLFDIVQVSRLRARRAALLADSGRLAAAADEYLRAAAGVPASSELIRLAAEQMLCGGQVDRGLSTLVALLDEAGMSLPSSALAAAPGLALRRLQLARRELAPQPGQADPAARFPCDVAWTLASGLALIDPLRAADFHARSTLYAVATGDPVRIARSLVGEALISGWGGTRTAARTAGLIDRARALAASSGDRAVSALAGATEGVAAVQEGRFALGAAHCRAAIDGARGVAGGTMLTSVVAHFRVFAQFFLGELDDLRTWIPELHAESIERGDHNLATNLRLGYANLTWLLRDGPDAALAHIDLAEASWSRAGFLAQHYYAVQARAHVALWRGDGDGALAIVDGAVGGLRRSMLLLAQGFRVDSLHLRVRCLLAAAAAARGPRRAALLARAASDTARLRQSHAPWARALAELHFANLRAIAGKPARAGHAAALLDECGLAQHAAAARHLDGSPPPTLARLLVPGLLDSPGR